MFQRRQAFPFFRNSVGAFPFFRNSVGDGLLEWWPLSTNNAEEISSNGGTGTLVASPNVVPGPALWTGLDFNGSSQYVAAASYDNYGNASSITTISYSLWFKTTSSTGRTIIFVDGAADGSNGTFDRQIYVSTTGKVSGYVYDGTDKTIISTASYNDGLWHHAALTINEGVAMSLYVDGASVASPIAIGTPYTGYSSSYFVMARHAGASGPNSGSAGFFAGSIADVMVYKKVLTPGEVNALYNMKFAELELRPDEWEMCILQAPAAGGIARSRLIPMTSGIIMGGFVG